MRSINELVIVDIKNAINPMLEILKPAAPVPDDVLKGLIVYVQHAVKGELMTEFIMDLSPRSRWLEMIRPYHEEGPYAET